jgi:hypothetical protein
MLIGMLARPVRHQRARHGESLLMGHRLAGLQPRHFHFGYAVAQLDDHATTFGLTCLMSWQTLRERVRIQNRGDAISEMRIAAGSEVSADAEGGAADQRGEDFGSTLHRRHL